LNSCFVYVTLFTPCTLQTFMHTNIRTQQNCKLFKNNFAAGFGDKSPSSGSCQYKVYTKLILIILHYFNQAHVSITLAIIHILQYFIGGCYFMSLIPKFVPHIPLHVPFLTVACLFNSNFVSDSPHVPCDIHAFQILYLVSTLHHLGRADEVRRTRRPYRIFNNSQLLFQ
jgi:hypothetical protein